MHDLIPVATATPSNGRRRAIKHIIVGADGVVEIRFGPTYDIDIETEGPRP